MRIFKRFTKARIFPIALLITMDKLTGNRTAFGKMNGMRGMHFMTVAVFTKFGFI